MEEIKTYGIIKNASSRSASFSLAAEELTIRGYVVVPDVVPRIDVEELNERLDAVYGRQCDEVGGVEALVRINDADIVRCPLAYDSAFLKLAQHPKILALAKEVLGDPLVLIMQNGIINRPNELQFQTRWHRDLNYQHWVSSAPLAVSALVCLEEFTEETGGTVALPSSHKLADFPSDEFVRKTEVTIIAPAGAAIIMDAMTFHRAGVNKSNRIRRGINHVIGVPILGQTLDVPAMLGPAAPSDPWMAGYLGYRWNPAPDVREWRKKREP